MNTNTNTTQAITHGSVDEIFSLENHNICREQFDFEPHRYAIEVVHENGSRAYSMGASISRYVEMGGLLKLANGIAEVAILEWSTKRGEFVVL